MSCRYGGRKLMTVCLLAGGMSTVLLPVAATSHPVLIIVFRVITGVSLSGTDSMIQAMWARWAPKFEKASLSSVAYTGSLGVLLAPLWWYCVHDSPELHPRMTTNELTIITSNRKAQESHLNKAPLNPPWSKILRSPAVWVILVGHISNKWITSFMMSYMPRFVSDLFQYNLHTIQNGTAQAMQSAPSAVGTMEGLFASLPFMGRIVSGIAAAAISDWMLRMGVSTSTTRKTFQAVGNWSCGMCTLFLAFIPMNPAMSMGFLVLALTMQNLTSVAYKINLLDIAPKYAGLLNGVMSTVSTLASLPAPVITSLLIADGSPQGWQAVFCMVAALTTFGGLIFILFARGDIQDWAMSPSNTKPADLEADLATSGRKRRHSGAGLEAPLDSYVDSQTPCKSGGPLREMRSLPVTGVGGGTGFKPKQKLKRSATVEVGAFVRRVRSQAFSNLPFSDFP
ncbi:vesicular glutamate transporter 1 [Elysia marginata]|uniref:Vesicular glutamate transporter 1 n=1 Tax=Elysia marginata TaxID=1093978 RepID=A0AAV4HT03_9GAST|nr:vesicular glutamate transporter 1 [Elysia marginata]